MLVAADLSEPGIALPRMRETIARRMRESLAATAQYTLTGSAGATGLLAIRRREKTRRPDVTINALVLFATVKALERIPELNGELKNGKLYRQRRIHLGFACDTDRGLMVPVIRNAEAMNLEALASAAKSLADAAVSGIVSPDDLAGATFTVSNLGALGIESFTPIINAPQVAILGVNSIELRPVRRDGRVEFEDRIGLSLTCDHQVIDGAPGARFLSVVRECIEKIELLSGLTA
jgi:pyruvate dehydrogenase E2 component (dihydrolipoamide acetyltransferase)